MIEITQMKELLTTILFAGYQLASLATAGFLIHEDWPFNWWNWIILIPIDFFLGEIWPIYWLLLRPFSS